MNDLDLCLEVVSRSSQPLRYIWRWISRKLLEIETWFQRTTNRKWHMGYRMVTWPMTSRDLWNVKLVTPIRLESNISKTTWARDFKFDTRLCMGTQINFPESGRGLGHVTPTIFGSTVGYPSDSLASCFIYRTIYLHDIDWNNFWSVSAFREFRLQSVSQIEYSVLCSSGTHTIDSAVSLTYLIVK